MAPASLTSWWLGWAEDSQPVHVRLAEVSGIVVAGLAGFGMTMLVARFLGPSPSWPLVIVVIDEAHTFFHERKGTSPEVKAHNALVAELSRLVEELVRKGRNVAIQVMLLTQRATG
jgi:DNA segregation ATPase FtsK/SpoIIIE, S-DNA-T family